jgi:hypothetical protein
MPKTKLNKQVLVGVVIALVFWALSNALNQARDFEAGFYGNDNIQRSSSTDSGWINRNLGGTVGGDGQCTYYNSPDGGSVMTGC